MLIRKSLGNRFGTKSHQGSQTTSYVTTNLLKDTVFASLLRRNLMVFRFFFGLYPDK